jgi:hypothetical protein
MESNILEKTITLEVGAVYNAEAHLIFLVREFRKTTPG